MRLKEIYLIFLIISMCFLAISCRGNEEPPEIIDNHYDIYNLDYSELYYTYRPSYYEVYEPFNYDMDDNGVIISYYAGHWYYNPVNICLRGINQYDRFVNVQDSLYLDYAFRHRDALIGLMDDNGYFEYRMNYHHFDIYFNDPWYSGMAQGLALSLLSRLAYYANDTISANIAGQVYETLDPASEQSAEVVNVDRDGYAWIEEYPGNPPDRTFNGFMHAIIGLYDYYHLVDNSTEVKNVLSAYLTTVEKYMRDYRNPENISYYCLRHHHIDQTYHKIHVRQLQLFTNFTQDSTFANFADTLITDYWNY